MNKKTKVLLAVLASLIVGFTFVVQGTLQEQYYVLRAEAIEQTPLDLATAGDFANKPSSAKELKSNGTNTVSNGLEITILGGDAADETFSWRLLAWKNGNGPAKLVATGTGILGTQAVNIYPQGGTATNKFWADTLVITAEYWGSDVNAPPAGGNSVAQIELDARGWKWWELEITNASGAAPEANQITGFYTFF